MAAANEHQLHDLHLAVRARTLRLASRVPLRSFARSLFQNSVPRSDAVPLPDPSFRTPEVDKKGFITYFRSLPEDPKVLRIFNRKDFYSVHGDDATFVARAFYKTTTVEVPRSRRVRPARRHPQP